MNAAARMVHQSLASRRMIWANFLSKGHVTVAVLTLAVLLSALSVIYVTHVTRVLHASYQRNLAEQDRFLVEHGQLLLERSTWMMQSRIQQIAESRLGMVVPDGKSVVVIHE